MVKIGTKGTPVSYNVKLLWITHGAETQIAYCARASSDYQDNPEYKKLFSYLLRHKHWSPFEMASMCVEIVTSRAIAAQILRHRSISFQEFSQRYSKVNGFQQYAARRIDSKNRQNSIDDLDDETKRWFEDAQISVQNFAMANYEQAISRGIAKECARSLLPSSSTTRLYMSGTIRSWLHYIMVRTSSETQFEHRQIANEIKDIFCDNLPIIGDIIREFVDNCERNET